MINLVYVLTECFSKAIASYIVFIYQEQNFGGYVGYKSFILLIL